MSGSRCLILVRGISYKMSTGAREVTDVQIKLFQTDTVNEHTFYVIIVTLRVNLIICLPPLSFITSPCVKTCYLLKGLLL